MFVAFLVLSAVACALVQWAARRRNTPDPSSATASSTPASAHGASYLRRQWLSAYLIIMGADWMMGPYLYHLYDTLGLPPGRIALLFLTGYVSSGVFGTFAGTVADSLGRKRGCLAFCCLYIAANLAKFATSFPILFLGHVLSGVGTSLLHSSFEAWMVCEHNARKLDPAALSETFSMATFANGLVSIVASLVATALSSQFGPAAPFGGSVVLLVLGFVVIFGTWGENFGDETASVWSTIALALEALRKDWRILAAGTTQALFEGSMYNFVFLWSASLSKSDFVGEIPYGIVFATFMVCIMLGSSLFSLVKPLVPLEYLYSGVLAIAAFSMGIAVYAGENALWYMVSFVLFEICCGLYFPCSGTLRGILVPESCRSGMMNLFRIPLNILVTITLLQVDDYPTWMLFAICTGMLATGSAVVACVRTGGKD